jgi:hypothetical protein
MTMRYVEVSLLDVENEFRMGPAAAPSPRAHAQSTVGFFSYSPIWRAFSLRLTPLSVCWKCSAVLFPKAALANRLIKIASEARKLGQS